MERLGEQRVKDLSSRNRPTTGGGTDPPDSPYTDIVLDILGDKSPSLVGLVDSIIGKTAVGETTEAQASFREISSTETASSSNVGKIFFLVCL